MPYRCLFTLLFVCLSFLQTASAQSLWADVPGYVHFDASQISFATAEKGWMLGRDRRMMKTEDGGVTWQEFDDLFSTFEDLQFVSENVGFVCGTESYLARTSDGGLTWDVQQTGSEETDNMSLFFISETEGWMASLDSIMHTVDGGLTWTGQTAISGFLRDMYFVSPTTGWAVGEQWGVNSVIYRTTDGGVNWVRQEFPDMQYLFSVMFTSDSHGVAVGRSGMLRTTDGGENWASVDGVDGSLHGVFFPTPLKGFAVGVDSSSYLTVDGGETWTHFDLPLDWLGHEAVTFFDEMNGWIAGLGTMFRTTDGGATWNLMFQGTGGSLRVIEFPSPNFGIAVGGDTRILRTVDSGVTWQLNHAPGPPNVIDIEMVSDQLGWAGTANGQVFKTIDGGLTWEQQSVTVGSWVARLRFVSEQIGWALHSGGIKHTTDGGNTWQAQNLVSDYDLESMDFVSDSIGWVVGENGRIRKTINGGLTWQNQTESSFTDLVCVDFVSPSLGWIADLYNRIYRTTDGGQNWQLMEDLPTLSSINEIHFISDQQGWIVGGCGVMMTIDGGETWTSQHYDISQGLNSMYISPTGDVGFAVGGYGQIITYYSSSLLLNSKAIESTVFLYPNPTNDLLTVKFDGEEGVFTLYDALGNVLESMPVNSGSEVSLKNHPAGVYVCALENEKGSIVKRIVKM